MLQFYESYFDSQRDTIFRNVEVLIYVFDIDSGDVENDMSLFDAEETYISVSDWRNVIKYDIKNITFEVVSQLENDISMSSECLHFLIKNKWGRGTVLISGRCQINYEKANNFFNQTNLWYNNNIGKYLGKNLTLNEIVNQDNFYQRLIGDL